MAYNSRQSNVFRSSQQGSIAKTPASVMKKKRQQKQEEEENEIIMHYDEILVALSDLQIAFNLEDLQRPTPVKVQYLFEAFADRIMGVSRFTAEPLVRAAGEHLDNPEGMYDTMMLMMFHRSVVQLMVECGIQDFSLIDLLKPEPERLRKCLSYIINFLRFRGERWSLIEQYSMKGDQTRERIDQLYFENEELQKRVEELRAQRKQEEPAIAVAAQMNQQLTNDLRNLKKKQVSLTAEIEKMKHEKETLVNSLKNIYDLIQIGQRDCLKLQPYIVDSPEKLSQVVTDMGTTLSNERAAVDAAERKVRALQTSADSFALIEQDVTSCIKLMEDCEREMNKLDESKKKVQRHEEAMTQKEAEVRELERKEERLERLLENARQKLDKARKSSQAKREQATKDMQKLKEEYETLSKEREATNRENDRKTQQIDIKQKEMADLKEKIDEECRQAMIQYEQLCSHITRYMTTMEQHMARSQ